MIVEGQPATERVPKTRRDESPGETKAVSPGAAWKRHRRAEKTPDNHAKSIGGRRRPPSVYAAF